MDKIFIIALFCGITFFFTYSSEHTDSYPGYKELLGNQAQKLGRLPDVTIGATDINVHYRSGIMTDDPRIVLSYEYHNSGIEGQLLKHSCREKKKGQLVLPADPPSFWKGNFGEGYKYYWCAYTQGNYAINTKQKKVWFWRNRPS